MPEQKFTSVVSSTEAQQTRQTDDGSLLERNYERPPEEHPIFHAVGRVTVAWARLEHALDRIIWILSHTISPRTACITAQLMGATPRYRAILAQLRLRSYKEREFGKYIQRFEKLMQKTYEPQERRNRIIHDPWLVDTIHDAPAQFRSWPHKDPQYGIVDVDMKNINKTISDIESITNQIESLFADINSDVATSLEKQRQRQP